jgi:hypothetical protein
MAGSLPPGPGDNPGESDPVVSTLRFAAVKADGLLADLDLPLAAYRALLKLRSMSEPGGLIAIDQASIGALLGLSRSSANAALRTFELARLVTKVRNGVYQINAMLAGYNSPRTPSRPSTTCLRATGWTLPASSRTTTAPSSCTRTSSPSSARSAPHRRSPTPSASAPFMPSVDSRAQVPAWSFVLDV